MDSINRISFPNEWEFPRETGPWCLANGPFCKDTWFADLFGLWIESMSSCVDVVGVGSRVGKLMMVS